MDHPPATPVERVGGVGSVELVEHVDLHGRVIEVVTRSRMRAENLRHRSVAIIVTGSDGRLLVHRRADDKDLYPGWWDIAAGGVVGAGEVDDSAAVRELAEELGVTGVALDFVASGHFDDEHAREICQVYRVVHDGPFRFDDGEVAEARWVTPVELDHLVATARVLPGSLAMIRPWIDGFGSGFDHVRFGSVQRVEFTIEPFVEGQPGRHVTAPVDAVRTLGIDVEFGPFGSECTAPPDLAPEVVAAIVRAAFANGATHVNIDVTTVELGGVDES